MQDLAENLFINPIFKILLLCLLLISNFEKYPQFALIIFFVYILTSQYINNKELKQNVGYLKLWGKLKSKR